MAPITFSSCNSAQQTGWLAFVLGLGVLVCKFCHLFKIRLLPHGRVVSLAVWVPNLLLTIILGSFSIALENEASLFTITLDATGNSLTSEIGSWIFKFDTLSVSVGEVNRLLT